jgi:hypothetical protein
MPTVKRFLTNTTKSDEGSDSWAEYAIVEIGAELAEEIRKATRTYQDALRDHPNLSAMSFYDSAPDFYSWADSDKLAKALGPAKEIAFEKKRWVRVSTKFELTDVGCDASRDDNCRLVIVRDGFFWKANEKHSPISVETQKLPFRILEDILEEAA